MFTLTSKHVIPRMQSKLRSGWTGGLDRGPGPRFLGTSFLVSKYGDDLVFLSCCRADVLETSATSILRIWGANHARNTRIHGVQPTSFADMDHAVQGIEQELRCAPRLTLIKHLIRPK